MMRSAVHDAAASASSAGPGTTSGVSAATTLLESRRQRLLEEHVIARQGQLDPQQFLGCTRLQTDGSLSKVLITKPDLRREPASSMPVHAETSGALIAAGIDEELTDTVLERIIRSEFQRHLDADGCHPAADPAPQQSRLRRRPIAAVKDGHPPDVAQAFEHARHVEELRGDVPPGDQPQPVEVADGRPCLRPAGHPEEAGQVPIVEALVGVDHKTIGQLAKVIAQYVIELGPARAPEAG